MDTFAAANGLAMPKFVKIPKPASAVMTAMSGFGILRR
jgi:hypothetical protein